MPGWTDLKAEMAACWNTVWNVDPLPLSVPERAALVPDDDVLFGEEEPLPLPLDEHAARERAAAARTTAPAVVTRGLRRPCISDSPFPVATVIEPRRPACRPATVLARPLSFRGSSLPRCPHPRVKE